MNRQKNNESFTGYVANLTETCDPENPLQLVTKVQVALTREQRFENVKSAFLAEPARQSNLSVLLVDDVFTTGATITEAAKALTAVGFNNIYAITLAKASIGY